MPGLQFQGIKSVLCVGAHSDDIEIGCGATLLRLLKEIPKLHIQWVVFSAKGPREIEAKRSAAGFLKTAAGKKIEVKHFRESYFPSEWPAIKEHFEKVRRRAEPDLVFTHFRDDRHQDHRVLSDLAWNTFRNHLVLEYEIPKYDGDLGRPNFYVPVAREFCEEKIAALMRHFQTQTNKHWFSPDTFWALLRLRGIECASESSFAEAFYCRKGVLRS